MAAVTNVILNLSAEEFWCDETEELNESCPPLDNINQWIQDGKLVDLTPPTYENDAGYGMEAWLFGGGFRNFDIESFIRVVGSQRWRSPQDLQLLIKCDDEHSFSIVEFEFEDQSE